MSIDYRVLGSTDLSLMRGMLHMFAEAFDDHDSYTSDQPRDEYLAHLLDGESFIALAALENGAVVGGIAAYEMKKFEQERSEIYIYDLAVSAGHRRRGIATGLINELQNVATDRGAYVIFVQADTGVEDEPAIALYSGLGTREEVLYFELRRQ